MHSSKQVNFVREVNRANKVAEDLKNTCPISNWLDFEATFQEPWKLARVEIIKRESASMLRTNG
jgi:hypothetical protein